jgi:hypothetical protein
MTRDYGTELAQYDGPCRAARRQAFDEIRAAGGGDVIVAQNWFRLRMSSETTSVKVVFRSDKEWAEFAGQELERLKATLGIQNLLVIGNVPTLGGQVSPVDCIARPIRLNDVGCRATPLAEPHIAARKNFNTTLRESVEAFASFANPYDYLCDQGECANFVNGLPLYSNETHLSEVGSSIVVKGILESSTSNALSH